MKVYLARAMTGCVMSQVVDKAINDTDILNHHGIDVLDPVVAEGVKRRKKKLQSTQKQLAVFWRRDKEMIRECHVVFDMTPWAKSEGVAHEIGYARYFLWKPVVRVYDQEHYPNPSSVAYFEDDVLAPNLASAIEVSLEKWGTPWKRLKWRVALYNRSLAKALYYKFKEWWVL